MGRGYFLNRRGGVGALTHTVEEKKKERISRDLWDPKNSRKLSREERGAPNKGGVVECLARRKRMGIGKKAWLDFL